MTSRSAKRSLKKSDGLSGKLSVSKAQQIEQFFGIDEAKCETAERTSKSPSAKRSRSSTNTAVQLLKKMAKHKKELNSSKESRREEDEREMENIPDTLDELNSRGTEDERGKGTESVQTVNELDELLDSETAKRIQSESEVTIRFCCPLLANVGSVGQLFSIDDFSPLKTLSSSSNLSVPPFLCPFVFLFLSRPHSRLRCTLFDRFRQRAVAAGGAIAVPYDTFVFAVCYAFQVSPIALHFSDVSSDVSFEQQLDKFAALFAPSKVRCAQRRRCLFYANIELLLNVWHFLRFDHLSDLQIVALCRALARLFLDVGAREFRAQLSRAFQMIFRHFPSVRRRSVLSHFLTFSFFSSADHSVHAAFVLSQMFSQFDQSIRLLAIQSILKSIILENDAKERPKLPPSIPSSITLGDAFDGLSEAVSVVRRRWATEDELTTDHPSSSSSLTVLYLLCNRWLDSLTADERLLIDRSESEASLEKALQNIRQANEQLNRRNINDKMIHTWAQSEHRIRAALLRRQKGQLRMSQAVGGNTAKSKESSSSKRQTFVGSSSEDDGD
ncbi:hypothetical protein niasHS_002134 [Heterodera schachtii]|uniref:Uncharacterized protein n=1 Tax=Heterodera schachtii TaxID=97005 RepID=A0ABD2KMC0_HETSC